MYLKEFRKLIIAPRLCIMAGQAPIYCNMRKTNCLRGKQKKNYYFLMLFLTYLSINNYSKAPETCKLVRETSKYLARIEIIC